MGSMRLLTTGSVGMLAATTALPPFNPGFHAGSRRDRCRLSRNLSNRVRQELQGCKFNMPLMTLESTDR